MTITDCELVQLLIRLVRGSVQTTEPYIGCRHNLREAVMINFQCQPQTMQFSKYRGAE